MWGFSWSTEMTISTLCIQYCCYVTCMIGYGLLHNQSWKTCVCKIHIDRIFKIQPLGLDVFASRNSEIGFFHHLHSTVPFLPNDRLERLHHRHGKNIPNYQEKIEINLLYIGNLISPSPRSVKRIVILYNLNSIHCSSSFTAMIWSCPNSGRYIGGSFVFW